MGSGLTSLPTDLKTALTAELMEGESVLYAGRPNWRAYWHWLAGAFAFGLFWSAIAWTFFASALAGLLGYAKIKSGSGHASTGMLIFFLVFSLPFVAIGLAFLAAPFVTIYKSGRTVHAVTTLRLLDVCLSPSSRSSQPLARVMFVKRRDGWNGRGTLQIGYGVETDSEGDRRPLTFEWSGIPDVKRAEQAIHRNTRWVR